MKPAIEPPTYPMNASLSLWQIKYSFLTTELGVTSDVDTETDVSSSRLRNFTLEDDLL